MMKVIAIDQDKGVRVEEIDGSLKSMQKLVNGHIEIVSTAHFSDNALLICNEEGKIRKMPLTLLIFGENMRLDDMIVGPCFICASDGEEFTGLTEEQIEKYLKMFESNDKGIQIWKKEQEK